MKTPNKLPPFSIGRLVVASVHGFVANILYMGAIFEIIEPKRTITMLDFHLQTLGNKLDATSGVILVGSIIFACFCYLRLWSGIFVGFINMFLFGISTFAFASFYVEHISIFIGLFFISPIISYLLLTLTIRVFEDSMD